MSPAAIKVLKYSCKAADGALIEKNFHVLVE